jgi:GNAT superfamily N-acetyltransferase
MNPIVWHRLARYLRTGDLIALGILAGRAVRVVQLDHVMIMGRALDGADTELDKLRARRPDLRTRFARSDDLGLLVATFPHHAADYADRMRLGDQCLLVEAASQPLAFTWLKLQPEVVITELGCRVALPARGVWGYDTFVLQEARLAGAFVVLMAELLAELRRRGASSVFGTITHTNRESLVAHQRAGYRLALTLSRVQLPGVSLCRIHPPAGSPHYATFARRAPELVIQAPGA